MNQVTAVIADDEAIARAGLRDMLAESPWITVAGEAASGPEAVQVVNALRPELLFLDIQMPGLLGTEVLDRLDCAPHVVFTTAYAEHAVGAFELGALDYLLKPFGIERLAAALARVRTAMGEGGAEAPFDRLREVLRQGPVTRLFVRQGGGIIPLAVADVTWFEARGDYVAAHAGAARYLLHVPLARLESRLDPAVFLRVHRTHIVNLGHVRAFRQADGGRMTADLTDGTRLAVSRTRARELRALGL